MSLSKNSLRFVACLEWLMVLPAGVFLAAAVLRLLQPPQYEPARTSWVIVDWTVSHVSRAGAGVLFLGLPALVALIGAATLLRVWADSEALRKDATTAATALRRHRAIVLLGAASILALAIVGLVLGHSIADLPR